jgi:hypothetical protein
MHMKVSEVRRLSDDALRVGLKELVVQDRTTTVRLLIHIGEFDSRRLYRAEGFSCMKQYCMTELEMSEDIASKRIWVARRARRFPRILVALNDGSLTLSAVAMLSKHLSEQNSDALLDAATRKTNAQVAEFLATRFPRPDLPTLIQPLVLQQESVTPSNPTALNCQEHAARHVNAPAETLASPPRVMPLAPQRYGVQFTISQGDRELLRHVQNLLAHGQGAPDEGEVFVRALQDLAAQLEKRKYGATDRPRKNSRESKSPRHVPARVRRAVRERDQGRCTFVAPSGRRCEARGSLEFDHIEPAARGGRSSVSNLRLRCRAHNQYSAEQAFGHEFIKGKIEQAREGRRGGTIPAEAGQDLPCH